MAKSAKSSTGKRTTRAANSTEALSLSPQASTWPKSGRQTPDLHPSSRSPYSMPYVSATLSALCPLSIGRISNPQHPSLLSHIHVCRTTFLHLSWIGDEDDPRTTTLARRHYASAPRPSRTACSAYDSRKPHSENALHYSRARPGLIACLTRKKLILPLLDK